MTYTIWHAGIMIGESAFDQRNPRGSPLQRAALFTPTSYGRTLFPRLTGILTAGADLKDHLEAKGLDPERMDADDITDVLETTEGGRNPGTGQPLDRPPEGSVRKGPDSMHVPFHVLTNDVFFNLCAAALAVNAGNKAFNRPESATV